MFQISTTNVSYLDTSDSVVDQRMDAGDNRWWKRAYFQMQVHTVQASQNTREQIISRLR